MRFWSFARKFTTCCVSLLLTCSLFACSGKTELLRGSGGSAGSGGGDNAAGAPAGAGAPSSAGAATAGSTMGGTSGDGGSSAQAGSSANPCVVPWAPGDHCGLSCPAGDDFSVTNNDTCVCGPVGANAVCAAHCVDTRVDAANCGACGAACAPGAICAPGNDGTGVCGPAPVELTRVEGCDGLWMTLNAGVLFYTDSAHGTVSSLPVTGGTPTVLASSQPLPLAIAADAAGVYWSNTGITAAADNALMMKATGSAPAKICDVNQPVLYSPEANIVRSITLDGTGNLYFGAGADVMKVRAVAGALPSKINSVRARAVALVLFPPPPATPDQIFATVLDDRFLQWVTLDGTPVGPCPFRYALPDACDFGVADAGLKDTLRLVGKYLLWADGWSLYYRAAADASTTSEQRGTAAVELDSEISGFTNTASSVYFGARYTGSVRMVPFPPPAGGTSPPDPVTIAKGPLRGDPASFQIDEHYLYWRTQDPTSHVCSIMKLAL